MFTSLQFTGDLEENTSVYQAVTMAESVKKLLDMGDFHSVVDCVQSRITSQHTNIVSRDIEKKLREKVKSRRMVYHSTLFMSRLMQSNLCPKRQRGKVQSMWNGWQRLQSKRERRGRERGDCQTGG